ncbi:MAG TPA: 2-dehydropantoate 2-reductase [Verrucomicrobiae bacterium]|jgi:2-dehydropantoate 2-reductase
MSGQTNTHIAIVGPGAIGGTLAVRLASIANRTVVVCARTAIAQLILDAPEGQKTVTPKILTAPDQAQPVDWILVATKAYDATAAAGWFQFLTGPHTRLAVLQNGVEHIERFSAYFPPAKIMPVVVDLPVERVGPGHFHQRRAGHLTVPADANGEAFRQLFLNTGMEVRLTSDFRSAAWHKLAINCAGAVSAVVLKPAGISRQPAVADLMRALVRECIAVGRAEGAVLDDSLVESVITRYQSGPADAVNSMHADHLAGRPMEADVRNGVIVRLGKKHNIPAPINEAIVALLNC